MRCMIFSIGFIKNLPRKSRPVRYERFDEVVIPAAFALIITLTVILTMLFAVPALCASLGEAVQLPVQGEYQVPRWAPDGSGLALGGGAFRGLYLTDFNGNIRQISNAAVSGYGFSFSPDGRNIAYRERTQDGTALMVTGPDGKAKLLAPYVDKAGQLKWGKDGLTYKAGDEIITVDEKGNVKRSISLSQGRGVLSRIMNVYGLCMTAQITGATLTSIPSITPSKATKADGDTPQASVQAYVDEESQAWIVDEDGNKKKLIDLKDVPGYSNPVQSPDGGRYALRGFDDNIYIADPMGGDPLNLGPGDNPSWSPDGQWVIYTRSRDDGHRLISSELWISSADGRRQYQLTDGIQIIQNPSWSPDGSSIAYVVDGAVYVAPVDL